MMKAILLSIKSEWLAKISSREKTIEVRKKFPKDYVGWVYLYCIKGKHRIIIQSDGVIAIDDKHYSYGDEEINGKVVARFWCDKVDHIWKTTTSVWLYETEMSNKLYEKSCLSDIELDRYFKLKALGFRYTYGRAIHISKLEIFDRPRELGEFKRYHEPSEHSACWKCKRFGTGCVSCSITKAPQNYCYIDDFFFDNEEAKEPESVLIDEKETDGLCR